MSLEALCLVRHFYSCVQLRAHKSHSKSWSISSFNRFLTLTTLFLFIYLSIFKQFIMACGKLVKILLHSKVTRYLEFKSVDGSYVFKDGKVQKVPATPAEALNSSLMGFFEKRKFRNFLIFLSAYDEEKPSTYLKGTKLGLLSPSRCFIDAFALLVLYSDFLLLDIFVFVLVWLCALQFTPTSTIYGMDVFNIRSTY